MTLIDRCRMFATAWQFRKPLWSNCGSLPKAIRRRIGEGISRLQDDLSGDVKKLSAREEAYRLRVGSHRILFRLEGDRIAVYAVKDRKNAYE